MKKSRSRPSQSYLETLKPEERSQAMNDHLLTNFSDAQKTYIIEKLYPELKKALVHFVSEAKRFNQIDEGQIVHSLLGE